MKTGMRSRTTSPTFQVAEHFIDHTNVPRANVVTEAKKMATGRFKVRVQRDQDGTIANLRPMLLG